MLNATTGASTLPRDVIQWLDRLDLSYSVRNPKMDLSNGFIIAQILTREYPEDREKINILTFYNCQAKDKKINNWQQIQKFLARKGFKLPKEQYQSIINLGPESAQTFLFRLYEKTTGNKLNIDRRLTSMMPPPEEKLYKKPTASHIAKDRELHRVVDNQEKQFRTKTLLEKHKNHIHNQKYNTGLIEWLIDKRKKQIQVEIDKQREDVERKTKSIAQNQSKVQVREIQLKCFNSSTSKKNKADGDFIENKGVLEFLAESCSLLFKKQSISNDLKKLGLEIREKEPSNLSIIQEMFKRCDENDIKGNKKISPDTLRRVIDQFKKNSEMNLIIDNISTNFIDFRKFFDLFYKPLRIYDKESQTFKNIIELLTKVAAGLQKRDPSSTQQMFEEIVLVNLLKIGENEYKRPIISSLCLEFVRLQSDCYFSLTQKVKKLYLQEPKTYIAYLARFLQVICKNFETIEENLWSEFFYYGFQSLSNPASSVRVNGAKIISLLFTEIAVAGDDIINEKMAALKRLIVDPWWEVRAQALIIYKAILMGKYKNQSSQESSDINEDLNIKTILHYVLQIFKPDASHNVLRVGLVELAEVLNYEASLCERYLEVLLHVGSQIRADVLNTSVIKYGPVVYGSNTFTYKLTGAPLIWNSIGLVRVLHEYLERKQITQMNGAHLQILYSAIMRNQNSGQPDDWLDIFEKFKRKIFQTLLDEDLCEMAASIIKEFLKITEIHRDLIDSSRSQVARTLSQLYIDVGESQVKNNLLDFFNYLSDSEPEYTYKILKNFAEREKSKYLSSNLVDFMNDLTRNRRKQIYNEV